MTRISTKSEKAGTSGDGASGTPSGSTASLSDHIDQNIENILALQRREWEQTQVSQRRVERVSRAIGRPIYLVGIICCVVVWITGNLLASSFGGKAFDPPPFSILQGILTLVALLTTTIVLIAQNRQTKLEQQHSHLDLQVNLLTEQKVSKMIVLIEELRHDLPMVRDRHDAQAAVMQEAADTDQVLKAIKNVGLASEIEEVAGRGESKTPEAS